MLNPMPGSKSPLFKRKDSLKSNHSKNSRQSKQSKHSGIAPQKEHSKQSIILDSSIDNANLKLLAREFTLRAGEKLGLKSQSTMNNKKMNRDKILKPTLASRVGDGLLGSFLKIPGMSPIPMEQLKPNKKFLMDDEKKNSGY